MSYRFATLDVFTDSVTCGNPLAVVLDSDALTDDQMQSIAREFNLSETVFVSAPENAAHSAKLRIFTPYKELPFAGHPTLGAAILLAEQRYGSDKESEALIILEEKIGILRCGVVINPGTASYAEFDVPQQARPTKQKLNHTSLAAALGLLNSEIGFDNHRPTNFTAGVPFGMIPVRDIETLSRARPIVSMWHSVGFGGGDHQNAFLYTRIDGADRGAASFRARMFAPDLGIVEDPATGAAAAAFAGVLAQFEGFADGHHDVEIFQGAEMGRPSKINLTVELVGGRLKTARIGGQAVRVLNGELLF